MGGSIQVQSGSVAVTARRIQTRAQKLEEELNRYRVSGGELSALMDRVQSYRADAALQAAQRSLASRSVAESGGGSVGRWTVSTASIGPLDKVSANRTALRGDNAMRFSKDAIHQRIAARARWEEERTQQVVQRHGARRREEQRRRAALLSRRDRMREEAEERRRASEAVAVVLAHFALAARTAWMNQLVRKARLARATRKAKEWAAHLIQRRWEAVSSVERGRRYRRGIQFVRRFLMSTIIRRRFSRKTKATDQVKRFLQEFEHANLTRVVTNFYERVKRTQRYYREYVVCSKARVRMLAMYWDKIESGRLDREKAKLVAEARRAAKEQAASEAELQSAQRRSTKMKTKGRQGRAQLDSFQKGSLIQIRLNKALEELKRKRVPAYIKRRILRRVLHDKRMAFKKDSLERKRLWAASNRSEVSVEDVRRMLQQDRAVTTPPPPVDKGGRGGGGGPRRTVAGMAAAGYSKRAMPPVVFLMLQQITKAEMVELIAEGQRDARREQGGGDEGGGSNKDVSDSDGLRSGEVVVPVASVTQLNGDPVSSISVSVSIRGGV